MRSQLNRGRRLISAFVPALAWWRASRVRMFHSWRHRSGLGNEAAILIPQFGGSNPPAPASQSVSNASHMKVCQKPRGTARFRKSSPVTIDCNSTGWFGLGPVTVMAEAKS